VTGRVGLRPATDGDRDLLLRVYESTRTEEVAALPWTDAEKAAFLRQQAEAQDVDYRASRPSARFLVVTYDGADVGRLYRVDLPGELRLMDLSLLPEHRGRGIGSGLLADLVAEADQRGMTMTLHVEHWNPARRLYDRLGFIPTADNQVYVRMERPPRVGAGPASS
jgi:ribosomal protein S18 acetylase RimI-like enzyme